MRFHLVKFQMHGGAEKILRSSVSSMSLALAPPSKPGGAYPSYGRCQLTAHVSIADFAQRVGLGWIGMDHRSEPADPLPRGDREGQLADHFARVACHNRATEDFTAFLVVMDAYEAIG